MTFAQLVSDQLDKLELTRKQERLEREQQQREAEEKAIAQLRTSISHLIDDTWAFYVNNEGHAFAECHLKIDADTFVLRLTQTTRIKNLERGKEFVVSGEIGIMSDEKRIYIGGLGSLIPNEMTQESLVEMVSTKLADYRAM